VAKHLLDVELAMQPHPGAGPQRGEDVEQAEGVRRRRGELDTVAARQLQRVTPLPDGRVQRRTGVADGLRQTGGAGTEHQQRIAPRRLRCTGHERRRLGHVPFLPASIRTVLRRSYRLVRIVFSILKNASTEGWSR
jgi:hypothetical protein